MRASHDSRETFAQVSRDSRETFAGASHDTRETSARLSYDVRASFIISQLSLEMVLFMSQSIAFVSHIWCRTRKLNCNNVYAKGWRRVGDGFATHAMTWRLFCVDFCGSSRCMRGPCDPIQTSGDCLVTSSLIDSQNIRELVASQEIGA